MQEKVEKYIYRVANDKFRIKFLRIDNENNKKINFDQYIIGTLEDAIKLRDDKLKENNLLLEKEKKNDNLFDINNNTDCSVTPKENKKKSNNTINATKHKSDKLVDKYIYEIDKGKKYKIFIRKGGTGDYYSGTFDGPLSQAKKERDRILAEFKLKHGKIKNNRISFLEFVKIYYNEYANSLSPATVGGGKSALRKYILPVFADVPLCKIDVLSIQKFMNELKHRDKERKNKDGEITKLSANSLNSIYRILRKIMNKAVDWNFIEYNPVLKVETPPAKPIKEKSSYNLEQLVVVLELLLKEYITIEALFTIAICTGLRRSEILGIHVNEIDFENGTISINHSVVWDKENKIIVEKETKTKGSVRIVPIPIFCIDVIKEYIKLREKIVQRRKNRDSSYLPPNNLFLGRDGGLMFPDSPTSMWKRFREKNSDKIKDDVTLHGLRHSYCSIQMNENDELAASDVQRLMGHSILSTTFIYTHSNRDINKNAVSIFDKIYEKNNEMIVNFNQMLSLYTGMNFACSSEIIKLINFAVKTDVEKSEKCKMIRDYIDKKYPIFKTIDISNISINNVWDMLDMYRKRYGDKFLLQNIQ